VQTAVLERVHERPQRGLSAAQRQRNASGAFAARSRVGGRVLLVDDVMTTGATLRAGVRQLRRAGARQVDVVTLARVVTTL
jgi:predicted amidophosphoribosyltransferase